MLKRVMTQTGLTLRHLLLALAVVAIWGSNFVVIRIGLDHLPPLLFAALRFSLAILPALFVTAYPGLAVLDIMRLGTPTSAILSALIFNEWIDPISLMGAGVIVAAGLVVMAHERIRKVPEVADPILPGKE